MNDPDEAFARAYAQWSRVARMDSPGGWTYRTAFNVMRRRHRRARLESMLLRSHRIGSETVTSGPGGDWSPEVWDALRRLPRRERTAVALRYVTDLPTDQVAQIMGVAPGTIGSTLHSARKRLAVLLRDDVVEPSTEAPTPIEEDSNA